jgi:hypothetical protein
MLRAASLSQYVSESVDLVHGVVMHQRSSNRSLVSGDEKAL